MEFILLIDTTTNLPVWIRRDSIISFCVSDGDTTIVLGGAQDNDAHIRARGDVTDLILGLDKGGTF